MTLCIILQGMLLAFGTPLLGAAERVNPAAVSAVMNTLEGPAATESPVVYQSPEGYIHFLGAPPQARFLLPGSAGSKSNAPENTAKQYLSLFGAAFGVDHDDMTLETSGIVMRDTRAYVRMNQLFDGIPVVGAQVVVQVNDDGGIRNILSDVMRDTTYLDNDASALTPLISADQAVTFARGHNAVFTEGISASDMAPEGAPHLVIYHPALFEKSGDSRLAWSVKLVYGAPVQQKMVVLLDARTGDYLVRYAEGGYLRNREVYDCANNQNLNAARLVRKEGDSATGNKEIDNLYDYLGDCYDWYWMQHGRDSFDDKGSALIGYANYPWDNAAFYPGLDIMIFGTGFVADDVVAHEYTHAVSDYETPAIYYSFSGALLEMFSDLGGEFVDLTNGRGNDSSEVRWYLGEDLTLKVDDSRGLSNVGAAATGDELPGIRYMKDPTVFGDPDRLGSPLLADPFSDYDLGGVHINNGIGNKLIYLLTDGDDFNGQSVKGMGIPAVADLFYEARAMLGTFPTYFDLYFALGAASIDLGFNMEERLNIVAGTRAVEIEPPTVGLMGLRNFRATPAEDYDDNPVIALTWDNPPAAAYQQLTLYRSVNGYPTGPIDGESLGLLKSDTKYLDRQVRAGVTYYYTLIADILAGFPQILYAKATADTDAPNILSEAFGNDPDVGTQAPFDLSYTQITIRPVAPPPPSLASVVSDMDYNAYEATTVRSVYQLPVARNDAEGGAYPIGFTANGIVSVNLGDRVFPYFGEKYNTLYVGMNGYIIFYNTMYLDSESLYLLNYPSLATHYALPRISFLFANLAPQSGGEVWARVLKDRTVITFVDVPVLSGSGSVNPQRNTVQVELYDSGHIRMTYLKAGIQNGVVGLSDGRGVPKDPSFLFDEIKQAYSLTDFYSLSPLPKRMSVNPVAPLFGSGGEALTLTASALSPSGLTGMPVFTAEWDGPIAVPFADMGNGTGKFYWETSYRDKGIYNLRVKVAQGNQRAYQDVRIIIGEGFIRPIAEELGISTGAAYEDPYVNRPISIGTPLIATYAYQHPYSTQSPMQYSEGASILYWFRNGQLVSAFTNLLSVPPGVAQPGERWWFQVTPITLSYIWGEPATSPVVIVLGTPVVESITPPQGLTIGGDTVIVRGKNLSNPIAVRFGDVPASSIRAISDTEISVVTPIHAAGKVSVVVETPGGVGRMVDAFTYGGDVEDVIEEEDDKPVCGCASVDGRGGFGGGGNLITPAAAMLMLSLYARSTRKRSADWS